MSTESPVQIEKNIVNSKPKLKLEYNVRTLKAFILKGLEPNKHIRSPVKRLRLFHSKEDTRKGPVQRIINSMHRVQITEFDEKGAPRRKEYFDI